MSLLNPNQDSSWISVHVFWNSVPVLYSYLSPISLLLFNYQVSSQQMEKTARSDHYSKVETALEEKLQAHISAMYPSKVLRINYTYIIKFFYSLPIVTCNELALCRIVHISQTFYLFSNISESVKKKVVVYLYMCLHFKKIFNTVPYNEWNDVDSEPLFICVNDSIHVCKLW